MVTLSDDSRVYPGRLWCGPSLSLLVLICVVFFFRLTRLLPLRPTVVSSGSARHTPHTQDTRRTHTNTYHIRTHTTHKYPPVAHRHHTRHTDHTSRSHKHTRTHVYTQQQYVTYPQYTHEYTPHVDHTLHNTHQYIPDTQTTYTHEDLRTRSHTTHTKHDTHSRHTPTVTPVLSTNTPVDETVVKC